MSILETSNTPVCIIIILSAFGRRGGATTVNSSRVKLQNVVLREEDDVTVDS